MLKSKLEAKKGVWVDELQKVLWAYKTTTPSTTGETPFSLVYGTEAMISAEYKVTSQRRATFDPEENAQLLAINLDLLEEAREVARLRVATYQQRVARYYNRRVRVQCYNVSNLVLCLIHARARKASDGTLGPNLEGSYIIKENLGNGAYHLTNIDGAEVPRA